MISNAKNILLISGNSQVKSSVSEMAALLNAELDTREHSSDTVIYAIENSWNLIIIHAGRQSARTSEICRKIKRDKKTFCQILVVSEFTNSELLAGCLNNGADDFIVYPWNTVECFARATAAFKRAEKVAQLLASPDRLNQQPATPAPLSQVNTSKNELKEYLFAGDVRLCPFKREITISEKVLQVTRTEYSLFFYLVENISRPCSSTELLRNVLGYDDDNYLPSLHSHVSRLRRKIKISRTTTIETIWCYGYRILT